ncbi:hypothetical protein [Paracidovorax sp. MALMAid1276]|uniref:hypothetical protein n=1 Tax=Paracidovorax sp. MALMAid1276 TaxID=3411631 RepID=UPI003B9B955B
MSPALHTAAHRAAPDAATHLWARHLNLVAPGADTAAAAPALSAMSAPPALSASEAARVLRHRDQLLAALHARDRSALHRAKQEVLDAAFRRTGPLAAPPASPALRRALRDLAWRMAALLLPRSARPGAGGPWV